MSPLLAALVDDAGLFPPSWLPMDQALARHRASSHPVLSGRFLGPGDRVGELLDHLGADEALEVHLVGDEAVPLPDDPRITVRAVELRSGVMGEIPCYVEGVAPSELAARGVFGKVRCGGVRIPAVEEVAAYVSECTRLGLPFKATAGMHAAVRGWESTKDQPHHGYLNLLLAVARALTGGDAAAVLASTDADALAAEALSLDDEQARAVRGLLHSYGSCDTARPVADAVRLGLVPAPVGSGA
ncbi:MAG TPA: hypothetical protein VMZ11_06705 [Mycobacteriales bacterium]|nr:hypothetical protein [Mycobacteriales bacterium]